MIFHIENGDIKIPNTLKELVLMSLFTWKQLELEEVNSDGVRYGWWADPMMGSKLSTYQQKKITADLVLRLEKDIFDALKWMISDGVCDMINVRVEKKGYDKVYANIVLIKDRKTIYSDIIELWFGGKK